MSPRSHASQGRTSRAWTIAFRRGFERSPPLLIEPVGDISDPVSDELIRLLEQADDRLIEGANDRAAD